MPLDHLITYCTLDVISWVCYWLKINTQRLLKEKDPNLQGLWRTHEGFYLWGDLEFIHMFEGMMDGMEQLYWFSKVGGLS